MAPRLLIELDDPTHNRADRQERDRTVDAIMNAAGLPILHIPTARSYSPADLSARIQAALNSTQQTASVA